MNPTPEGLEELIYAFRGKRVMLDADLARLYGVPTGALNQAVRRNRRRFPPDFMFALSPQETKDWISQIVISNPSVRKGLRKPPNAFTEQGVAMLSGVLNSPQAVAANVAIMRAFVKYRETLALNRDLAAKLDQLERRVDRHDGEIGGILDAIRRMIEGPPKAAPRIGFKA